MFLSFDAVPSRLFLRGVKFFLAIAFFFFAATVAAQTATNALLKDSLHLADSLRHITDSLRAVDSLVRLDSLRADSLSRVPPPVRDTLRPALQTAFTSDTFLLRKRLFFTFTNPVRYTVSEKKWEGKDVVFYTVVALLFLFALIKNGFSRYLHDLYSAYFRTTVRQKQIKEQLQQSPLPSLFFNAFFVASAAVFTALVVQRFGYAGRLPFALLALYAAAGIGAVYGLKFLLLKFFGWVLQLTQATDAYLFVVFSTNKILGIFLLPFSVLLAFAGDDVGPVALSLSLIVVVAFFAYRYFLAFISINHLVRLNAFHFLLYLAAFEVLPLLLINKLLFAFLSEMA